MTGKRASRRSGSEPENHLTAISLVKTRTCTMASLADQLKAIRPSKTAGVRGAGGGLIQRPSLLFTPSEAAELDSDAIYSIGISGLAELSKLDPTLTKFEKTLFIRSGTDFRREHQTHDVIRASFFNIVLQL